MESFTEDQQNIHKMLKLPFTEQSRNVRKSEVGLSTELLTKRYFTDISPKIKKKLEIIFEMDFKLFGYSPKLY